MAAKRGHSEEEKGVEVHQHDAEGDRDGTRVEVFLPPGFEGEVTLHCSGGRALKHQVTQVGRPSAGRVVDLNETRGRG